jgi:4-diphosphocytidyl-2-C-methyl-D-erythritol kinase
VVGRRPDGYHELHSLMCGVALYDRLVLQIRGESNEIPAPLPGVPGDETNLAPGRQLFNQALAPKPAWFP